MTTGNTGRLVRHLAILAVAVPLALACSSTSSTSTTTGSGTLATLFPVTTADAGPTAKRANCDIETLTPVVQAKHAGASLADLACSGAFAAATITGAADLKGDGVALLIAKDGTWTLVASDVVGADPATLVPKDFGLTTYNVWRQKYDDIHNPSPSTTRVFVSTTDDPLHACDGQPDSECTTTTTEPLTIPTTVTTLPPPTVTVPPTEPPTTQGGGGGVSPYCQANPFDKNCLANPSFPG